MENNKISFFVILIVLLLVVIVIFTNACLASKESKNISDITSGNETEKENVDITITEETEKNTVENSEESDSTSSDNWMKETLPDETKTDENNITFKGNKVNENIATITLELDVKTGEVSGALQMGFKSFDMNMNSTKICDYVLTGSIVGNLDIETFKIEGYLTGRAVTDTVSEDCKDYDINYKMFASIADDYSKIRGYFDTNTMDKYEFFLKKVNQ